MRRLETDLLQKWHGQSEELMLYQRCFAIMVPYMDQNVYGAINVCNRFYLERETIDKEDRYLCCCFNDNSLYSEIEFDPYICFDS